jgi:hypothetical protein
VRGYSSQASALTCRTILPSRNSIVSAPRMRFSSEYSQASVRYRNVVTWEFRAHSLGCGTCVELEFVLYWVGVVVATRVPSPLATLVFVGGLYGVFAILLQQTNLERLPRKRPGGRPSSAPVLVMSWVGIPRG